MGPAEPDGGVRPQVHFQAFPLIVLDLGQVDGQHPPDEEGGGALPGEPGHPQAAQQGGMELHLQGDGDVFGGQEFHRQLPVAGDGDPSGPRPRQQGGAAFQGGLRRADHPPAVVAEGFRLGLHQVGVGPEQVLNGGGEGQLALQRGPRLG